MNHCSSNPEETVRLLNAIRDPIRMDIIFLLAQNPPMNVGDISARFKVSRPAISHHLKVLKDAGIVQSEKIGQEIFYRLNHVYVVLGLRNIADEIEEIYSKFEK